MVGWTCSLLMPQWEVRGRRCSTPQLPSSNRQCERTSPGMISPEITLTASNSASVFLATKYAGPAMQITSNEKPYPGGSIIGTASTAALRSNGGSTDYSASKAGVVSIMQTACYQLAGTGVRCNALLPGMTETGSMYLKAVHFCVPRDLISSTATFYSKRNVFEYMVVSEFAKSVSRLSFRSGNEC